MEQQLIFVYAAYFFTFFALIVIGLQSIMAFIKANKNIDNFNVESDNIIQKK